MHWQLTCPAGHALLFPSLHVPWVLPIESYSSVSKSHLKGVSQACADACGTAITAATTTNSASTSRRLFSAMSGRGREPMATGRGLLSVACCCYGVSWLVQASMLPSSAAANMYGYCDADALIGCQEKEGGSKLGAAGKLLIALQRPTLRICLRPDIYGWGGRTDRGKLKEEYDLDGEREGDLGRESRSAAQATCSSDRVTPGKLSASHRDNSPTSKTYTPYLCNLFCQQRLLRGHQPRSFACHLAEGCSASFH